ncbi:hypothetical protein [Pseudomonas auratipiscis]|uniref:hypothetical protein n=1 Tax=Pseudomonas auratipiscis TaxID=3115853 RepID=UPI002E7B102F|nr:hypothetical protein [Pseudomonas sp. 119P]MEE1958741.1 hypothetical protein [Pseudomonas sp. 119P]
MPPESLDNYVNATTSVRVVNQPITMRHMAPCLNADPGALATSPVNSSPVGCKNDGYVTDFACADSSITTTSLATASPRRPTPSLARTLKVCP